MLYICLRRDDIPNGVLQITDIWPNTSQRNATLDPPGQTKYINRPINDTLTALSANTTTAEYNGLAAYLIDHVIKNSANVTITVAVANSSALALIALLDAGSAIDVDAVLQAETGDATTTINGGGSNGTLADVLKILAGAPYVLPSGSLVGALAAGANLGSFPAGTYRNTYDTGALKISFGEGQIAGFMASDFNYDEGTPGPALVIYAAVGDVYAG